MIDFATPIWLTGLIPWGALAAWLMLGRRTAAEVPFLALWDRQAAQSAAARAVHLPPWAIRLAMLAALLALAAAAGPNWRGGAAAARATLIIDRGGSMSVDAGGNPRFVAAAADADRLLRVKSGPMRADLIDVPGTELGEFDSSQWAAQAARLGRTAVSTSQQLREAVAAALTGSSGLVILLSDQPIDVAPSRAARLIRPALPAASPHVGIQLLAARDSPRPQVMIRLANSGPARSARLSIESDGPAVQRDIALPVDGSVDTFVDVASLGEIVEARLPDNDGTEADDRAWLARRAGWPAVEAGSALPATLSRVIEIFGRDRPPSSGASRVTVVAGYLESAPAADHAAMIWPTATQPAPADAEVSVVDGELTAGVNWHAALAGAQLSPHPPAGWMPVVSLGERGVVWARTEPARQVWIGFWSDAWPKMSSFVVFCSHAFTWAGGAQRNGSASRRDSWAMNGPHDSQRSPLPPGVDTHTGWWPGIFRRADGSVLAIDASPALVDPGSSTRATAQDALTATSWSPADASMQSSIPLSRGLAAIAAALAVMSILTWPRYRHRRPTNT